MTDCTPLNCEQKELLPPFGCFGQLLGDGKKKSHSVDNHTKLPPSHLETEAQAPLL